MPLQDKFIEGIVLKNFTYREDQRIILVFTREKGLLKFLAKGLFARKSRKISLTSPLTKIECICTPPRSGEFYYFKDISLKDSFETLKTEYHYLEIAGKMVQGILKSQLPEKAAPLLFDLLSSYLRNIPLCQNPLSLLASFYLKILRHEGLLSLPFQCAICEKSEAAAFWRQDIVCSFCAPTGSLQLSDEEQNLLTNLALLKNFSQTEKLSISQTLAEKVSAFFFAILA
ncbi:MAG: hypothetical protein Tsb0015_03840 [Simkaniaceae bacterium]